MQAKPIGLYCARCQQTTNNQHITKPMSDRKNMISNVFRAGASSRPEIAIRLNDTIAPIIQDAALRGCDTAIF